MAAGVAALACSTAVTLIGIAGPAAAAAAPVGLGTAGSYSVLGGSTVTNTGLTVLGADLGVSPGSAIPGFPPGIDLGTTHKADAPALQAKVDLVSAYNDAAGRAVNTNLASAEVNGKTLVAGVYRAPGTLQNSGTLTLDAQNDPSSVWIFQIASTLNTSSFSTISMINGAQACHVYWQVGSSATLGTTSHFVGTIMALTSISVTTGTTVEGRALARNGAVTLDDNVFTQPGCDTTVPTTPATSATGSATVTSTATATATSTGTATTGGGPTGTGVSSATATIKVNTPTPSNTASTRSGVVVPRISSQVASPNSRTSPVGLTSQHIQLASTGLPVILMRLLSLGILLAIGGAGLVASAGSIRAKYSPRH